MKLYTDHLTAADLYRAAGVARDVDRQDIYIDDCEAKRGRKRHLRIDFHAGSEHGRYARNSGTRGGAGYDRAASWDAWGYMLARIFNMDPDAVFGSPKTVTLGGIAYRVGGYDGIHDFRKQCETEVERIRKHHDPSTLYARTHTGDFLKVLAR